MASQDLMQQQIQRATAAQQKYVDWLMSLPHVVGVGVGFANKDGARTGDVALIVMVDHKVPEAQLAPEAIIPKELDGVRVDVQETGVFTVG
jgi:hypothetical protein